MKNVTNPGKISIWFNPIQSKLAIFLLFKNWDRIRKPQCLHFRAENQKIVFASRKLTVKQNKKIWDNMVNRATHHDKA